MRNYYFFTLLIMNKNMDSAGKVRPQVKLTSQMPQAAAISLLSAKQKRTSGKKVLKRILITIILVIVLLGGAIFIKAANISQKIFVGQKTTFFGKLVDLIRGGGDNAKLTGQDLGQINILLLGIGGEGHDGPYLSDTMILAQIRPDISEVTLTSIPRDYWADLPNGGQGKINEAFSDGYLKNHDWNEGGQWATQAVEKLSSMQIPYFAVLDFSGFEKAVDSVGGVDVTVDRTFTDYSYPDNGTGYLPPQTFSAGPQHMNGAIALIFARSRHAAGIEGSDFARGQRQQKIIEAFKQKVLGANLVKDVSTINGLLGIVADHFHTNISPAQIFQLYNLVKGQNMQLLSLSLDPDTHLICPEILASTGAYVLTPCPGKSTTDVENFFKNSFAAAKLKQEAAIVWLASSTGNKQAYDTAFRLLTDAGLTVYNLSYNKDNLLSTLVYQVNPKPSSAEFIQNELSATAVNIPPPGVTVNSGKVDVIVVLGQNAPIQAAPDPYVAPPARTATTSNTAATTTPSATTTPTK
jgi:LCP family protein required for cell wall assembly